MWTYSMRLVLLSTTLSLLTQSIMERESSAGLHHLKSLPTSVLKTGTQSRESASILCESTILMLQFKVILLPLKPQSWTTILKQKEPMKCGFGLTWSTKTHIYSSMSKMEEEVSMLPSRWSSQRANSFSILPSPLMPMWQLQLKWQSRAGITLQSPWKLPISISSLTVLLRRTPVEWVSLLLLQGTSILASPQLRPAQSMEDKCWRWECGRLVQFMISWLMLIRKPSLLSLAKWALLQPLWWVTGLFCLNIHLKSTTWVSQPTTSTFPQLLRLTLLSLFIQALHSAEVFRFSLEPSAQVKAFLKIERIYAPIFDQ